MATDGQIHVCILMSPAPREVMALHLKLAVGSTVGLALQTPQVQTALGALDLDALVLGIWGKKTSLNRVLEDQDRLEIYRPLKVDPKVARRQRFVKQGIKKTGLFATRRPGAKTGY